MRKSQPLVPNARRRAVSLAVPSLFAGLLVAPRWALAQNSTAAPPRLDVPYVPTPQPVVDKMLDVGKVGKQDVLYDLGCGDGRIVVTAVKNRGASRAVGIDIDPQRIAEAKENAQKAGVADKVEFRNADLFESDFSPATVVTLYLLPSINQKLRPQLWKQLKVGTRVVSHDFDMGEAWPPERTERVNNKTIYYWTIKPEHKKSA